MICVCEKREERLGGKCRSLVGRDEILVMLLLAAMDVTNRT